MWKSIPNSLSSKKGKLQKHNKEDFKDSIPMDLIIDILTRLPVKSLLKFQYVSKTWCSIIRSKYFINSSVLMSSMPSSSSSSQLLIAFKNGKLTNKNVEKRLFFFTSSQKEDELANLEMTMGSMEAYFYTRCASINGFICLSHKGRFMICNPSTKQVITLPEIAGKYSMSKYLGYDPINDQYKAMCKKVSTSKDDQEHMILTLGEKNPSWRHIEGTNQNYYPLTKGICINGFVYYGASTPNLHGVIICFDVRLEKLSFINLPSNLSHTIKWNDSTSTLINYKGNLAYVNVDSDARSNGLWVLEDVKEHRWSLKTLLFLSFVMRDDDDDDDDSPMSIQGTNKFGELIIAPKFLPCESGVFNILYCDLESKNIRKVQLHGVGGDDEDFRHRYGIGKNGNCHVYISPDYGENISFL